MKKGIQKKILSIIFIVILVSVIFLCRNYKYVKSKALRYAIEYSLGNGATNGNVSPFFRKASLKKISHLEIDVIYDDKGNPIIKENSKQICYLNGIPAYSRVYSVPNNFFNIVEAYNVLIEKISAMDTIFVDEGNLYLGVKTTSGASTTYYFYNKKTGEKEYLDSLAISLNIGVKFDTNITEENTQFLIIL